MVASNIAAVIRKVDDGKGEHSNEDSTQGIKEKGLI